MIAGSKKKVSSGVQVLTAIPRVLKAQTGWTRCGSSAVLHWLLTSKAETRYFVPFRHTMQP